VEKKYTGSWNDPDVHIGFCMSPYVPKECNDCFSVKKCLALRDKELVEAEPNRQVEKLRNFSKNYGRSVNARE
jgi:hypothetical protein